ncbi:MAG: lipopolysaccharide biosynthesis protein [Arcobacter sp.]|nr:lipopolysaccharide biosynthesis protein [Arcobacter sp.]|tara:strand:- start:9269 stop:10243 length:975 start_codon:yes stop_codon:yes gene_type:complete
MEITQFIASRGYGGAEKVFIDLCNELNKKEEIKLTVILLENNLLEKHLNKKIKIVKIKDYSKFNILLYLQLISTVKNKVIHTHASKATKIIYYLSKILTLTHIATKHNARKGKIFNKIKNVTAVSIDVLKSIKNNNVELIYNGIIPLEKEVFPKNEVFTIRAIGRLDKIKGFDKLIADFVNIKKECVLEIIGDGPEHNNLEKKIKDLKLESKIKLLGFRKDIPALIRSADLIVMTSLSEGFSIVMVESIFYAKVFVSTNISGCREILTHDLLIEQFKISKKINEIQDNYLHYSKEFDKIKYRYQKELLLENITLKYLNYYKKLV